ncbi:MAG: 16S rRNA (uracil(1498)-N(3))-methyltransferase [Methylotenera sp.]|nr:16S rRNA (uracil(1498)-N(3))-methyltransferase [Oligoflexia bacterium]
MKRLLCPTLPQPQQPVELSESEAKHATVVLRLGNGDAVELMDGKGKAVVGNLVVRGKQVSVEFSKEILMGAAKQVVPFNLELAVIKGDGMEWAIEKAVELGVQTFTPVLTAHTVVQMDRKGPDAFQERWQKIADQALKQCGRFERMQVALPTPLEMLLSQSPARSERPRIWCDETSKDLAPPLTQWLQQHSEIEALSLLVGPEGGWSENERKLLASTCQNVSLGPLILRAETAAVLTSSLVTAHFRSFSEMR